MTNIVPQVVAAAVPGIIKEISSGLVQMTSPIADAVVKCACKDQIVLEEAINAVGPEVVQYSAEIAKRIVDCWEIAEKSECTRSELLVKAVMDDSVATIDGKVNVIIRWEKERTENKARLIKAAGGLALVGYTINNLIAASKEVVPKLVEEAGKTKRRKILLDIVSTIWGK